MTRKGASMITRIYSQPLATSAGRKARPFAGLLAGLGLAALLVSCLGGPAPVQANPGPQPVATRPDLAALISAKDTSGIKDFFKNRELARYPRRGRLLSPPHARSSRIPRTSWTSSLPSVPASSPRTPWAGPPCAWPWSSARPGRPGSSRAGVPPSSPRTAQARPWPPSPLPRAATSSRRCSAPLR